MNKLQKVSVLALTGTFILAGLSPLWAVNPKPRKLKKGNTKAGNAALMRKVNRKITLADLHRRGRGRNINFTKLGQNNPVTYALKTGLSVTQVKKAARPTAEIALQEAQAALGRPYVEVAVAAAQQAWDDAKLAGLKGDELAPYKAVLQQAKDARIIRPFSKEQKLQLASSFLQDAQRDFNVGDLADAWYEAELGIQFAKEAGLTGEALSPYQQLLAQIKQTLADQIQASQLALEFDPLHSGVPFTYFQYVLEKAKINELEGEEIDALENLVQKIEPVQMSLLKLANVKLDHINELVKERDFRGALIEAESTLEDLENADIPQENLQNYQIIIKNLRELLDM